MPINDKTGKADRSKVSAEEILEYRIRQCEVRKGKQPVRKPFQRGEPSGSGARARIVDTLTPEANFYIDVPDLPRMTHRSAAPARAPPSAPSPAAAPTTAPSAPASHAAPVTPVHAAPSAPVAPPAPDAPPAPVTPSAPSAPAAPSSPASHAAPVTPAPADSPSTLIGSPPLIGSPALAPALRRFIVPQWRSEQHALTSPSRRQQGDADATQGRVPYGDLADRIRALERRMDALDEWRHRDDEWKDRVEERLRRLEF
jgi:hypothetical protein